MPGSYQSLNAGSLESHVYTRTTSHANGMSSSSAPNLTSVIEPHGDDRICDRSQAVPCEQDSLYSKSTGIRLFHAEVLSRKATLILFGISIGVATLSLLFSFLLLTEVVKVGTKHDVQTLPAGDMMSSNARQDITSSPGYGKGLLSSEPNRACI